jgi:hypothetical protein
VFLFVLPMLRRDRNVHPRFVWSLPDMMLKFGAPVPAAADVVNLVRAMDYRVFSCLHNIAVVEEYVLAVSAVRDASSGRCPVFVAWLNYPSTDAVVEVDELHLAIVVVCGNYPGPDAPGMLSHADSVSTAVVGQVVVRIVIRVGKRRSLEVPAPVRYLSPGATCQSQHRQQDGTERARRRPSISFTIHH